MPVSVVRDLEEDKLSCSEGVHRLREYINFQDTVEK